MISQVLVCPRGGGLVGVGMSEVYAHGVWPGQGGYISRGGYVQGMGMSGMNMSRGLGTPPRTGTRDTMRYHWLVGGMHPNGMLSSSVSVLFSTFGHENSQC